MVLFFFVLSAKYFLNLSPSNRFNPNPVAIHKKPFVSFIIDETQSCDKPASNPQFTARYWGGAFLFSICCAMQKQKGKNKQRKNNIFFESNIIAIYQNFLHFVYHLGLME